MYKTKRQFTIDDFVFPYGKLKADNRWVLLSKLIPWDEIERDYAEGFVNNGAPAHHAKMAFGSLIIKQMLKCSDEELCNQVAENPYLQFFVGLKEFVEECPFGASTLVAFRKRFPESEVRRINDMILAKAKKSDDDNDDDDLRGSTCSNGNDNACSSAEHTLALDATVAPSDVAYPQDIRLLNEAREHLEAIIDEICIQTGAKKPRMYRNVARREYLTWAKSKKHKAAKTRRALRKQLGYVTRDLRYIDELVDRLDPDLSNRHKKLLETIVILLGQQQYMYDNRLHSVLSRIVSISQPWVRPIVRGKAFANTEFGAKIATSTDDYGLARIEDISFDAFNESEGLIASATAYFKRNGHWPDRILADKLYRTRSNITWCTERGIRLSGPKLGRPLKDAKLTKQMKAQERQDAADRNVIEGVYGTTKQSYGLNRVAARLEETTKTVIAMAILVFNLKKLLSSSLASLLDTLFEVFDLLNQLSTGKWTQSLPVWMVVME